MAFVAAALLVGAGASLLTVLLARSAVPRRRCGAAGYLALLAVLMLAGCRPAPRATVVATAPVDASRSFYALVTLCANCPGRLGLAAYRGQDGTTRWTYAPPAPGLLPAPLLYHAGLVFVFTPQPGDTEHSTLTAIRAADGTPAWHVIVQGFPPSLAAAGDYLVVQTYANGATNPSHLLVLRPSDGTQVHDIPLTSQGFLATDGDFAFYCSEDGLLSAYRLSSGQPIWKLAVILGAPRTDYEGQCYPKAADGTLYYQTNSNIALGVATPTVSIATPTPNSAGLIAADERDGHVLWRQPLLDNEPEVVGDGMLFGRVPVNRPGAGPNDTDLAAFSARDGSLLWRFAVGSPDPTPVVKSGPVIVYGHGNGLVALRASDGTLLWRHQQPDRFFMPIAATDGVVLIQSSTTYGPRSSPPSTVDTNPYLVALRPSDGSLDWQIPVPGGGNYRVFAALNVEP